MQIYLKNIKATRRYEQIVDNSSLRRRGRSETA